MHPAVITIGVDPEIVEVVSVLDAMHCDGFGASLADNCLPAGEISSGRRPVTVAAP